MDAKEGNRLIAEFMGWDSKEILFEQSLNHTRFHLSWGWLMPVVQKCYETDLKTTVSFQEFSSFLSGDITRVYNGVIGFIVWYNKNK